jgi:hypothetical protein
VDQTEFNELHESCVTVFGAYVAEAKRTQEAAEKSGHLLCLTAKRLLHGGARLGCPSSG